MGVEFSHMVCFQWRTNSPNINKWIWKKHVKNEFSGYPMKSKQVLVLGFLMEGMHPNLMMMGDEVGLNPTKYPANETFKD